MPDHRRRDDPSDDGDMLEPNPLAPAVPCRRCRYDLRGLPADGRCPECGTPVAVSIAGDRLRNADPAWLATLARGTRLILAAVAFLLACGIGGAFAVTPAGLPLRLTLGQLAGNVAYLVGVWWLTTPDPSGGGEDRYGRSRRLIRATLAVGLAEQAAGFALGAVVVPPPVRVLLTAVLVVGAVAEVVGYWATLTYLERLAQRLPDPHLAGRARLLKWGIRGPLLGVVLTIVVVLIQLAAVGPGDGAVLLAVAGAGTCGLAALVFGLMFVHLLYVLGRRLTAEAVAARQAFGLPPPSPDPLVTIAGPARRAAAAAVAGATAAGRWGAAYAGRHLAATAAVLAAVLALAVVRWVEHSPEPSSAAGPTHVTGPLAVGPPGAVPSPAPQPTGHPLVPTPPPPDHAIARHLVVVTDGVELKVTVRGSKLGLFERHPLPAPAGVHAERVDVDLEAGGWLGFEVESARKDARGRPECRLAVAGLDGGGRLAFATRRASKAWAVCTDDFDIPWFLDQPRVEGDRRAAGPPHTWQDGLAVLRDQVPGWAGDALWTRSDVAAWRYTPEPRPTPVPVTPTAAADPSEERPFRSTSRPADP